MSELSPLEKYQIMAKRIEELLELGDFSFDINFLKAIHKYLFIGLLDTAGSFRNTNLTRKEAILYDESVVYSNYFNIDSYLEYDMKQEKIEDYYNLTEEELIRKLSNLNIKLWVTHPFNDGNTRTISVFIRLLIKKLGFDFDNEMFKNNFLFYRNALVLASYETPRISSDSTYLKLFLEKLIFDNSIDLKNIDLYHEKIKIKKRKLL